MKKRFGKARILGVGLIVGLLAAGTYAFTNTNTVPASKAGQGVNTISGYTVTNVDYNESTTNPHKLISVEFDLNAAADVVKVSLKDSADNATTGASTQTWFSCTVTATAMHWTCVTGTSDLDRPEISSINELDVVAYES